MTFIINQAMFILINILMAASDADKIKKGKLPDHLLNGAAYILSIVTFSFIFEMDIGEVILFTMCCLFNRQLFFDIPLNLMRKLKWDYVSPDPDSRIDRLEKRLFGNNGKAPNYIYASGFIMTILINLIFF